MRIERASVADAETVARLNQSVQGLHVQNVPGFFQTPSLPESASAFGELLAMENVCAFIAYEDELPIGYVLLFIHERPANTFCRARRWLYLDQISVEPDWQGRSVGRELVKTALTYAQSAGIDEIEVETWAFNRTAQAFFRAVGFQLKTERLWMSLAQSPDE